MGVEQEPRYLVDRANGFELPLFFDGFQVDIVDHPQKVQKEAQRFQQELQTGEQPHGGIEIQKRSKL